MLLYQHSNVNSIQLLSLTVFTDVMEMSFRQEFSSLIDFIFVCKPAANTHVFHMYTWKTRGLNLVHGMYKCPASLLVQVLNLLVHTCQGGMGGGEAYGNDAGCNYNARAKHPKVESLITLAWEQWLTIFFGSYVSRDHSLTEL